MSNALRKIRRNVVKQYLRDNGYSVKKNFRKYWFIYQNFIKTNS